MKVLLILGVALLFTLNFAHHQEGHHGKDDNDEHDHHNHKASHHKNEEKKHQQNESLSFPKIAQHNTKFSFDLYRQVALDHPFENIVFSPFFITTAFTFLSLGAKDRTRSQIFEGFGFNTSEISEQEIHEGFHHLLDLLNKADSELQLSTGNALFISKERKILQTFLDEAKRLYHSEAFSTDFKNTKEAKKQINSYVEKQTHGKIAELLDSVDQDAMLVLINCIYFRGQWEKPFEEKWTKEGDFHVNEKKTVKVPFMARTGMYNAAFTDKASIVSLPYKGNASALFILPNKGKLSEVEQNLNPEAIRKLKKSMDRKVVNLVLPKFSVSGTLSLKETLSKMGITDVFSDNADLSGITEEANMKVSKVVHKAMLSVDEKGTEGAVARAIEAIPMSVPPLIKFNRPFIFIQEDHKSESILFSSRILNPME